jgi:hypothetical protein
VHEHDVVTVFLYKVKKISRKESELKLILVYWMTERRHKEEDRTLVVG